MIHAAEVPSLIHNGDTVVTDGMTLMGVADEALKAIEDSFLSRNEPRDLTWVHAAGQSNRVEGLARVAHKGLVKRVIGSHWGLNPPMGELLGNNEAEGVCLPQGQLSTLFRTIAAGRPGQLSTVGIGTYIDPRNGAGRINQLAEDNVGATEYVDLIELYGEEYLLYKSFPLNVAIIRGDAIDSNGNLSHREEASGLDALAIAQATHNSGGIVIAQVKAVVEPGGITAREVVVPAPLVDYAFVTTDAAAHHRQSHSFPEFDAEVISGHMAPEKLEEAFALQETPEHRLAVGARGVTLVNSGDVINVGTGIPADTVGKALAKAELLADVHLTVESGTYGGLPLGVVDFGCSINPEAIIGHPQQMDFYNGGGVDITFMGAGQVDASGDVNVSHLGGKAIGCGGFMDIVDGAKTICFLMSAGGKYTKYVGEVSQVSFSGKHALNKGSRVFLATEFYLLRFTAQGWTLIEADDSPEATDALERIPFTLTPEPHNS
ncbi:CoA-transferase [Corynebacterium pacaense]|uniref:CoA-transferase n=1 Tax=Corynebacterium pacaense TaxID=1816684 RepID=UPI0009BC6A94|nr:CoA-transferase [Corynebacterium pacaense]